MRHFNFRAWSSSKNKMYYPYKDKKSEWTIDNKTGFIAPNVVVGETDWGQAWGMLNEYILMQETGLRDSVGQEIYEGDLVSLGDENFPSVISWNNAHAGFAMNDSDKSYQGVHQAILKKYMVIGNIFENPELVNDKKLLGGINK